MARYPRAAWKPIGAKTTDAPSIIPTAVIDHSDAGYVTSLQGWWLNPGSGSLSCHFHIAWDGTVEQYVDTTRRAVANVAANAYGISIELSNSPAYRDGKVSFASDGYSTAQIAALVALHDWLAETHATIPRKLCTDGRNGFGWHSKFPTWTTPGHECPGTERVRLLRDAIYPRTFTPTTPPRPEPPKPEEPDMTPAQSKQLDQALMYAKAANENAQVACLPAIYAAELGRNVDSGGLTYWTTEIRNGMSIDEVRTHIAALPEAKRYRESLA